jgi:hypothetical protein
MPLYHFVILGHHLPFLYHKVSYHYGGTGLFRSMIVNEDTNSGGEMNE